MQTASAKIWTKVADSISYNSTHYTTGNSNVFLSLFNGISTLFRLFNAKAILLEEQ